VENDSKENESCAFRSSAAYLEKVIYERLTREIKSQRMIAVYAIPPHQVFIRNGNQNFPDWCRHL
jgi:hypothetical protein